jgi:uncharacterized protein YjbJ (UPF0337 family)
MGEWIDKVKGKVKQMEGSISGDHGRQAEGLIEEKKGDMKGRLERIKQGIKDVFKKQ